MKSTWTELARVIGGFKGSNNVRFISSAPLCELMSFPDSEDGKMVPETPYYILLCGRETVSLTDNAGKNLGIPSDGNNLAKFLL